MAVKNITAAVWPILPSYDGRRYNTWPLGNKPDAWTPVLPTANVNVAWVNPTGNKWTATNTSNNNAAGTGAGNRTGCGLQYAIDNHAAGDWIEVTAGAAYSGPFILKQHAGGPTYIVSSAYAFLPGVGGRVSAADAGSMAKIQVSAAAASAAIKTQANAANYRLVGLEVTPGPTTTDIVFELITTDNGDTTNATCSDNIVFDRCYIHGGTTVKDQGARGARLAGTNIAFVGCRVVDFSTTGGGDSQALWIYQGDGPFLIQNCYLEGASETVMSGGADPTINNSVPANITIRGCYMKKTAAMLALRGTGINVKNHIEMKNAKQVLVEFNYLDGCWADGQNGHAILITPRNQSGTAPWCVTKDITIRFNFMKGTGAGMALSGRDTNPGYTTQITQRVLIEHNQIIADGNNSSQGWGVVISDGIQYLTIRKNTLVCAGFPFYTTGSGVLKNDHLRCLDNMVVGGTTRVSPSGYEEFVGDAMGNAAVALPFFYTDYTFSGNVFVAANAANNLGNACPATTSAVVFTNYDGGDFSLGGASPYLTTASDGGRVGADFTTLLAGVAAP